MFNMSQLVESCISTSKQMFSTETPQAETNTHMTATAKAFNFRWFVNNIRSGECYFLARAPPRTWGVWGKGNGK